ncbi:MAG: AbrB/MazE/SpoVT family DNA-binding domain-containing protein [Chloroflexi bacterium]|nr:AbrB/MazE/SpoVT family DNA-binding domain-containing protein [Chloroflexota bacterium]
MDRKVKDRDRPIGAKISAKHQVTIPIRAMASAGLRTGDRVRAEAQGRGRVLLTREDDPVERYAGALTGAYRRGELEELRDDWD